ncbi:MAG: T9SS type A sorting domain-containing protein, partial [Flavitalea sp.]
WLDNSQVCQVRVSGLNYSRRYRFGFIGSSSPNGWFSGNYTATYTINGRTVYLNSWQNNTKIVYIGDITPDQSGQVLLNFSTAQDGGYGFNSGFIIEEYTDTQGGTVANTANMPIDAALNNSATIQPLTAIKAYPNPFSDFINLDFYNSAANNRISADVYDLSGRIIYRHNFDGIPAGHNTIRLSSIETKMGTGVYIIALKVNGKIAEAVKMIRKRN